METESTTVILTVYQKAGADMNDEDKEEQNYKFLLPKQQNIFAFIFFV